MSSARIDWRSPDVAASAMVAVFTGLLVLRAQYGVDTVDESFYLSMPLNFSRGGTPYVDELSVHQNAAMLLTPFVWAYTKLTGGTFALVLFARSLYLLGASAIAFRVYKLLREEYGHRTSVLASALPVLSVPFCLFGWSYNSFTMHFLLLSLFFAWAARKDTRRLYGSGVFMALAVWCYPPYAPVAFLLAGLVAHHHRARLRPALTALVAGALTVALPASLLLAVVGVDAMRNVVAFSAAMTHQTWTWNRFFFLLYAFFLTLGPRREMWPMLALVVFVAFRKPRWVPAVAALYLLVSTTHPNYSGYEASMGMSIRLAVVAWLFFPAVTRPETRALYTWVAFPALVAGLLSAMTSTNFLMNAAVGCLSGAVVFCVVVAELFSAKRFLMLAPFAVLFAFLAWHQWGDPRATFREEPVARMTARLSTGPYAGLKTAPATAGYLQRLEAQIADVTRGASRVAFDFLPGAYLFTTMRQGLPSAWTHGPEETRRIFLEYFRRLDEETAVFVRIKNMRPPYGAAWTPEPANPLTDWIVGNRRVILDTIDVVAHQGATAPIITKSAITKSDRPAQSP